MATHTVLLVDDDAGVRAYARDVLEIAGLTVLEAGDAEAAMALAATVSRAIEVLVTDVCMPGTDEVELARRVQRLRSQIGVLYMSGAPVEELVARGASERTRFLAKPFSPDRLLERLHDLVGLPLTEGGHDTGSPLDPGDRRGAPMRPTTAGFEYARPGAPGGPGGGA